MAAMFRGAFFQSTNWKFNQVIQLGCFLKSTNMGIGMCLCSTEQVHLTNRLVTGMFYQHSVHSTNVGFYVQWGYVSEPLFNQGSMTGMFLRFIPCYQFFQSTDDWEVCFNGATSFNQPTNSRLGCF